MLAEARARMVDVETGVAPREMRPLEADSPEYAPEPRAARAANGGAAKRPQPPRRVPEPAPLDQAGGEPATTARPDAGPPDLGTDGVLSLEDVSDPGDGSAAWRQGLRG